VPTTEALTAARTGGFDLVEVGANADPPVCRLMHFEAWQIAQDERRRESRRRRGSGDGDTN
jgi:translation initiation factor IF-3